MKYNRKLFNFNSRAARIHLIAKADGVMLDVYNGVVLSHDEPFDAEHISPLKSAWDGGFNKQYRDNPKKALERMSLFANDPRNLAIVGASSNRSRGHKTLWNWSPLCLRFVPTRNAIVRELYDEFDLTLTASQKWAMDWSDKKILEKYKHGIHMGKVRAWLIENGFYKFLMPF